MTIIDPREAAQRERRILLRLRAFTLVWAVLVAGAVAPSLWLGWLVVPLAVARYRRRLERSHT